jgi:hypothetical protein
VTESEFRDFIREERLRHEQANRRMERWLQKVEERTVVQIATLENLVEESHAQRPALFAMMDKLDSGGSPPALA